MITARQPIDIAARMRAEIARRDWRAVHLAGDRNPPVHIPQRRRVRSNVPGAPAFHRAGRGAEDEL